MKDQWPTRSEDNKIQMNKVYTVADPLITEEDLVVLISFDLSIIGDKRTVSYLYDFDRRSWPHSIVNLHEVQMWTELILSL